MADIQAVFYRAPDGSEPVDEFIETLDSNRQAAIDLPDRPSQHADAGEPEPAVPALIAGRR